LRLFVEPMELEDIPQVIEVDQDSYTLPWPASAYRREILHNRNARYVVLRQLDGHEALPDSRAAAEPGQRSRLPLPFFRWPLKTVDSRNVRPGRIIGYAGMWLMVDEAHITTIAIRNEWRGRGLGELLLASLLEMAMELGVERATLEVRVTNDTAQSLYRKYGFDRAGLRPRYYSDNNEDAYIMSTDNIQRARYRSTFEGLLAMLRQRLGQEPEVVIKAPAFSPLKDAEPAQGAD